MRTRIIFLWLTLLILSSCDSNYIVKDIINLDQDGWGENKILNFDFKVPDSSAKYTIYYTVRYNNDFQNYNLYVKHFLLDSSGKEIHSMIQGMDLFKPTTGEPYGSGIGNTYDYKIISFPKYKFPYPGLYSIRIQQYMRQPFLKGIDAFGINIKNNQEK